jgi:transcriptional regulator with XRE-family HTH domain
MVAERIREAMSEMVPPLSQAELAARLNVEQGTVSNWLSAKRRVSLEDMVRIAEITGKPLAWFFPGPVIYHDVESLIEADQAISVADRQALKHIYRTARDRRRSDE